MGISPFTPRTFHYHFFSLIESVVNLSGAGTHWQDTVVCLPQAAPLGRRYQNSHQPIKTRWDLWDISFYQVRGSSELRICCSVVTLNELYALYFSSNSLGVVAGLPEGPFSGSSPPSALSLPFTLCLRVGLSSALQHSQQNSSLAYHVTLLIWW